MASMVKFRTLATDGAELNIYASVDDINSHNVCRRTDDSDNTRNQTSQHRGSENVRKRSYRSVSVCLVLLCVLLLTAVIVLCVLINTNNQQFNIKTKNITEERDQLLTKYTNITEERDQLLTKYTNITEERDQLLTKYTNITEERDQLLTKYTNITNEREEILLRLKNLTTENEGLLTNLNNQRDQLTQQKNTMMGILKADGWKEYQFSLYFISSEKKSWSESRRYCTQKGADLIIINNRQEQDFIRTISSLEYFWIGLTDSAVEGRWKWVDGSTLTTSFWAYREPNGGRRDNCAFSYSSGWYDFSCNAPQKWICEKNILK
nr:asialoglycoprotein receptor 1-like isoform X2 [Misgurnus anguillicaudatus]